MINVKCFGVAREIVENDFLKIDSAINSVEELRNEILVRYPAFTTIQGFMIAVNQEYATDDYALAEGDEVAIIPPVSGG